MRKWARMHLMPAEGKINPAEIMGAPPSKK